MNKWVVRGTRCDKWDPTNQSQPKSSLGHPLKNSLAEHLQNPESGSLRHNSQRYPPLAPSSTRLDISPVDMKLMFCP